MNVYRIQPIGSELHGIETTTSNDELAGGVHVFESVAEIYGCREWRNATNVELVTISCERRELKANGDYEGVTLKKGKGQIIDRKAFSDLQSIVDYIYPDYKKECRCFGEG